MKNMWKVVLPFGDSQCSPRPQTDGLTHWDHICAGRYNPRPHVAGVYGDRMVVALEVRGDAAKLVAVEKDEVGRAVNVLEQDTG
jgi:hypothetical protein